MSLKVLTTEWRQNQIHFSDDKSYYIPNALLVGISDKNPYLKMRCTHRGAGAKLEEKVIAVKADSAELAVFVESSNAQNSEWCATGELYFHNGEIWVRNISFEKSVQVIEQSVSIVIGGKTIERSVLQIIYMQSLKMQILRNGEVYYTQSASAICTADALVNEIKLASRTGKDVRIEHKTVLPKAALAVYDAEILQQKIIAFTNTPVL